jgi:histidyl-tRNA synthetase
MSTTTSTGLSTAPARGMRDFLPQEAALRDWAISRLVSVYEKFGFNRIETPAVENIANLKNSEGGENLSLIFEILKRGDKLEKVLANKNDSTKELLSELSDLGLRFDLTVPLVRFFAQNQAQLPYPFKSIQIGSVWRAESPQAGRYRQFTQCDIDTFGIKSEIAEMDLIQATSEALLSLGFDQFTVRINDRRVLTALASDCGFSESQFNSLFVLIDKLDKIGTDGVKKELLEHEFNKSSVDKLMLFLEVAAKMGSNQDLSNLSTINCPPNVVSALENVIQSISAVSAGRYSIVFDISLVRGMGYYTGQIFEIVCAGHNHSIAGGGRYDNMVGKFTGRDVPACGLSIGFERMITILTERNIKPSSSGEKIALIFDQDRDSLPQVFQEAAKLRQSGKHVSLLPKKKDMRKQIDALVQEGFSGYASFYAHKDSLEIKAIK